MSLGETAVLAVELKLNGVTAYTSGIGEAEAATAGLNSAVKSSGNVLGGTASNFGLLKQAVGSTGTAIKGMGEHLKGVLTGPLGVIGLGAGLFTLAGAFKESIGKAEELGLATEKLTALTGENAAVVSTQVAVFEKYGISIDKASTLIGFAEKTLGKLNATMAGKSAPGLTKLRALQQQYGVVLTTATGKAIDFETELRNVADFYTSNAAASTKAYVASQLFGRGYQALIPVLRLGSKGIQEAEQAAKDLGLTLTDANASDLRQFQKNIRETGEAVSGLQLQLGLVLIPAVGELAKSLTKFLAEGGTAKIITGFKSVLQTGKELGAVITGTIIPTLQGLAGAAEGFWDAIPPPLRDILLKGFIADRTIKFLFGVSPIHLAENLLGDIAGPIIKTLVANRLIPQPVIVTNPGFGLPGGLPGAGASAAESGIAGWSATAGGAGGLMGLVKGIPLITAGLVLAQVGQAASHGFADWLQANLPKGAVSNAGADSVNFFGDLFSGHVIDAFGRLPGIVTDLGTVVDQALHGGPGGVTNAMAHNVAENAQGAGTPTKAAYQVERAAQNIADSAAFFGDKVKMSFKSFADLYEREQKLLGFTVSGGHTHGGKNQIGSLTSLKGADLTLVADTLAAKFTRSNAPYYRDIANEQRALQTLQKAQTAAIKRGDTHTASALGEDISKMKTDLGRKTDGVKRAIDRKKLSVTVPVTLHNNTYLNARLIAANLQRYIKFSSATGRYGSLSGTDYS